MKKGFTLIEMLAVIAVLAVLALVTIPIVNRQFKESEDNLYETQIENIKEVAKNWAADHLDSVPEVEGTAVSVTLSTLQTGGYIKKELKNPKTKENFKGTLQVVITYKNGNYEYTVKDI